MSASRNWHNCQFAPVNVDRRKNSADAEGNALSFDWQFITKPAGSAAALSDLWKARLSVKTLRRDQREAITRRRGLGAALADIPGTAGSLVLRRMDRRGRAKTHGTKSGSGAPLRCGL